MLDLINWEKRWDALADRIESLKAKTNKNVNRNVAISRVLEQLKAFAQDQFKYFYCGFLPGKPPTSRIDSPVWNYFSSRKNLVFPPQYALNAVLNRISMDIQVLERIIIQRQQNGLAKELTILQKGDQLAYQALQPAKECGLVEEHTTALVYFEKMPSIRVLPYSHIALIGIPYSCTALTEDFLAIPHEVGHYVYWHGKDANQQYSRKRIKDAFDHERQWLQNWLEEIFADVYGAVVSGVIGANGLQLVENVTSKYQFVGDDADHPSPIVRPHIYTKVVAARNPDKELLARLDKSWETVLTNRGFSLSLSLTLPLETGKVETVTVKSVYEQIDDAVDNLLDIFNLGGYLTKLNKSVQWPVTLDDTADLQEYKNAVDSLSTDLPTDDMLEGISWEKWSNDNNFVTPRTQVDELIRAEDWLKVLQAEGWTTQGPHGQDR